MLASGGASLLVIPTNYYGTLFSQLSHLKKFADGLHIVDNLWILVLYFYN
jgi:hypothetical protein